MVRLGLLVIGLFNVANGLYMLLAPGAWYASVPGVVSTGPMNPHFIVDISDLHSSRAGQVSCSAPARGAPPHRLRWPGASGPREQQKARERRRAGRDSDAGRRSFARRIFDQTPGQGGEAQGGEPGAGPV